MIYLIALVAIGVVLAFVARRVDQSRLFLVSLIGVPLFTVALFVGARGGVVGALTVLGIAAAGGLTWFVLFSGRVRTATPEFRGRALHLVFSLFFAGYALWIAAWLTTGLLAAIAGHSSGFHERLHAYGGAPAVLNVEASDVAPFSIDGSARIREMTFRAGSRAEIFFTNSPITSGGDCVTLCNEYGERQAALEHNVAIYRVGGSAVFVGAHTRPVPTEVEDGKMILDPATTTYVFELPGEGTYEYRCDVHPLAMRGSVRVLPADVPVTDTQHPGNRDMARRIAEVSHEAEDPWEIGLDYGFSFVSLGLGVFLVLLRPRERMARVFGVAMIGTAAAYNLQSHAALATTTSFEALHYYLHPITGISYIYALVLFPDGKLIPRFKNTFVRLGYRVAFFVAAMFLLGLTGAALPDFNQHPAALVLTFGMAIPVIGMIAQGFRLRRAPTSEARQQSRLLLLALAASFAVGVIVLAATRVDIPTLLNPNTADPTRLGAADAQAFRAFQPVFVVIPLALFAGILRYRLWDIDLVIRRTIVYGALAGFIGAMYVGVVVVLGGAIGGRTGLSIVTTVVVAVAFDPLRSRFKRVANRLVYGERATPYDVLAELSRRLGGATEPADVVASIAESTARAVGAAHARATLLLPSGARVHASFPLDGEEPATFDRTLTLTHQGDPVGEISVAKRPGDALRAADNRLLEALGAQVAIALQSLRLAESLRIRLADLERSTAQLEASRRRIVDAQDAERSRLERDIHERVETPLNGIDAMIEQASRIARPNGDVSEVLERAAVEANRVQDVLRELARGIFPPLLADRGLVPALESQARKTSASVSIRTTRLDDRFDQHAEAAVYFCCIAAIRSAARRARASTVEVDLATDDGWVTFEIRDPAHGLSEGAMSGTDMQVMVDRIESVGGRLELVANAEGTRVSGRVPAQPAVAAHSAARRSGSNADLGT